MRRLAAIVCIAVFLSSLVSIAAAADDVRYRLTDLGDLTKDRQHGVTFVSGINDKGEIVGQTFNDQARARGFLWRKGRMTDLGDVLLAGRPQAIAAFAVNEHSAVVGTTAAAATGTPARAFYWNLGLILELGTLRGMGNDAFGAAINDRGEIVGAAFRSPGDVRAVRWVLGIPAEIGGLADGRVAAQAFGINNKGQIVGYLSPGGTAAFAHAFLWSRGKFTDLGTLPGTNLSFGNALNDEAQVVGQSLNTTAHTSRAFLWESGTLLDLGKAASAHTNSEARAINKKGVVVGTSGTTAMLAAWIWQDGVTRNLNTLIAADDPARAFVQLVKANGINEKGEIAAQGFDRRRGSGFVRGYLLSPAKKK
jgi:probable HAF family extracellular repeat protein